MQNLELMVNQLFCKDMLMNIFFLKKLDNRIKNLRTCNGSLNKLNRGKSINNSSGYKNIGYDKNHKKWFLSITLNCRKYKKEYNDKYNSLYALQPII